MIVLKVAAQGILMILVHVSYYTSADSAMVVCFGAHNGVLMLHDVDRVSDFLFAEVSISPVMK